MSDLFEEGEFDNCADVLDDWFNSCNIQGVAEFSIAIMETVEVNELIECMRDIEKRKQTKVEELTAALGKAMDMLEETHAGKERMKEVDAIRAALKEVES